MAGVELPEPFRFVAEAAVYQTVNSMLQGCLENGRRWGRTGCRGAIANLTECLVPQKNENAAEIYRQIKVLDKNAKVGRRRLYGVGSLFDLIPSSPQCTEYCNRN